MIRKSIMSACVSAGLLGASLGSASAACLASYNRK